MSGLLRIEDLSVAYASHGGEGVPQAVRNANLTVLEQETLAIVGESGSGKTTIANAILGLLPPRSTVEGRVVLDGTDLSTLPAKAWRQVRGPQIGYVPQDPMTALNEVWSVGHHFRQTIRAHKLVDAGSWKALAAERLSEVGLADAGRVLTQFPHQLSGGMRQRVLIALALLGRPRLIVADEPTSALDVVVQRHVLDLLASLTTSLGASLLLITHDLGLVADRADRVAVMKDGEVVESGPVAEVVQHPGHSYTRRLLAAVPRLDAAEGRLPRAQVSAEALTVSALTKDFRVRHAPRSRRWLRAVDGVDLTVHQGECLALVGESGSGKSTVARLALGLERPTAGQVRWEGASGAKARSRKVQVVFQDPYSSLDPQFTVARTLAEPLAVHRVGDRDQRRARVRELLRAVHLPESLAGRFPSELSGGQRQRVAIARALALEPDVLICDEAVSALDVIVQAQILDTLRDLRERLGIAMLFITHDLAVVAEIADSVAVIESGRIVESGPVQEVFLRPQHAYTRELLGAVPGQSLTHSHPRKHP